MTVDEQRPSLRNGLYLDDCHPEPHWTVPLIWAGVLVFTAAAWFVAIVIVIELFKRWGWW